MSATLELRPDIVVATLNLDDSSPGASDLAGTADTGVIVAWRVWLKNLEGRHYTLSFLRSHGGRSTTVKSTASGSSFGATDHDDGRGIETVEGVKATVDGASIRLTVPRSQLPRIPKRFTWKTDATFIQDKIDGAGKGSSNYEDKGCSASFPGQPPKTTTSAAETSRPTSTTSTTGAAAGGSLSTSPTGVPQSSIVLSVEGVGVARFSEPADEAIRKVSAVAGRADYNDDAPGCPSGVSKLVGFKDLTLLMEPDDRGAARFVGWSYGADKETLGLRTTSGVTIGTNVAQLRRTYGTKLDLIAQGSDGSPYGDRFELQGQPFGGTLTGTSDTDTVTSLHAGQICGE